MERYKVLEAQKKAEKKKEHEFTCPICNATAHWSKAMLNVSLRIWCECGVDEWI